MYAAHTEAVSFRVHAVARGKGGEEMEGGKMAFFQWRRVIVGLVFIDGDPRLLLEGGGTMAVMWSWTR